MIRLTSTRKSLLLFALITVFTSLFISEVIASPPLDDPIAVGHSPAKNPPKVEGTPQDEDELEDQEAPAGPPTTEWTYHKSPDGLHPNGEEQLMVWLMNRARANPPQEGVWLATSNDPDVAGGRDFFGVDLTVLQNEFASYAPEPPAAFDVRLYNAAKVHSDDLIDRDAQDHINQFQRVMDAGFFHNGIRGNVFAYADNGLNAHAAFNIDWGPGTPDGMQTSRGHRKAVMSLDGDYTNVGLAAVDVTVPGKSVGPVVVTGNYAKASNAADHHNRFLVGTVWEDTNDNNTYDPGEGIGGVTVMPNQGVYYAVTANSGGYAIPITAPGAYQVTFSGPLSAVKNVTVADESVLLDLTDAVALNYKVYLPLIIR